MSDSAQSGGFAMQIAELIPPTPANGTGAFGLILVPFLAHIWQWVPTFVAVTGGVLGIVWYCIMIWESDTFKTWRKEHSERTSKRKTDKLAKRKLDRIAALQAEERSIQAELAELAPTQMVQAAEAAAAVRIDPPPARAPEDVAAAANKTPPASEPAAKPL